jgi:exopolysaccharide biosynthesis polyprenyl glycosylphosphotransferase
MGAEMLRRFSINFSLFSMAFDAILIVSLLYLTSRLRPLLSNLSFAEIINTPVDLPVALYITFPFTWVFLLFMLSVYDGRRNFRVTDEFTSLTTASLLAGTMQAGILYLTYRDTSRLLFLVYFLAAFLALALWRLAARILFRLQGDFGLSTQRVLIVGAGPVGREIEMQIRDSHVHNFELIGFLDDDAQKREKFQDILGGLDTAQWVILDHSVTDVLIALPMRAFERANALVNELDALPVKIWMVPDYFHLALHHAEVNDLAGIPMLDLRASALDDYQRMVKRIFDLLFTALFLLLALPLMGLIAVLIWLDDRGPILFRQHRVGENGRLFEIYKFRTMVNDAEKLRGLVEKMDDQGNLIHKTKNDPRVTRVGRFLRRFSLDELPQLFNILIGHMSLVGPRPELPYLVDHYQSWQRKRFAIPQGLTGWWQIHGRSDKPMHLHTEDDLYYIQNYSIWLDIQILTKTIWIVLRGKGAY